MGALNNDGETDNVPTEIAGDKQTCMLIQRMKAFKAGKENKMSEEMNANEMIKELAEENQTRKILEILNESKSLEEAKEKIKALLKK